MQPKPPTGQMRVALSSTVTTNAISTSEADSLMCSPRHGACGLIGLKNSCSQLIEDRGLLIIVVTNEMANILGMERVA
ncbi:hypothetical protein EVAR_4623_1 [Eumeta japonica]|uniref:Uncharacterized protein n=1 Tax=Eumeta variegata TaxID=151549 RepID=A0A4C1SZR1_EUMVA|nr:hypothetical protein EVAR_4623_1 [Eumeta japonica]